METHLELFHVGEVVLAGLLEALFERSDLSIPCVAHADCSIGSVLRAAGLHSNVRFSVNVPLAPVSTNGTQILFDGAHCVDVLAHDEGSLAVAFEAKLGLDRLTRAEFEKRFLVGVTRSLHKSPRVKGSMVAILNHRKIIDVGEIALCAKLDRLRDVVSPWFLVVRGETWHSRWRGAGGLPPSLGPNAHVVVFEEIAQKFGDASAFDALVQRLVGDSFSKPWGLGLL